MVLNDNDISFEKFVGFSDGQGFQKPCGYIGMGTEGKGQGTDSRTLEKPVPLSGVMGYH